MAISILYNIPSLAAENQLNVTNMDLQNTLYQLSTGSRINTGADDAAGLAIADGLEANVTALTQSALNATEGAGQAAGRRWRLVAGHHPAEPRRHSGHRVGQRNRQ